MDQTKPVTIWRLIGDEHADGEGQPRISKMVLDEEKLNNLLDNPIPGKTKVVLICVTGPVRSGKSFLLNQLLRHLKQGNITASDGPLLGFEWGNSVRPLTKGIQIWGEPLLVRLSNAEEVVVLLMDTEGTYCMESPSAGSLKLAAMSACLSSMLVLNLSNRFQQNYFDHLRYITEYGKLATRSERNETVTYQQLTFLIRDWVNQDEYDFGWVGGDQYLMETMKESRRHNPELNATKRHLRNTFTELKCFLMPSPNKCVTEEFNFSGRWDELENPFRESLRNFVETLLSVDTIQVKNVDGREVLWKDLPDLFRQVTQAFTREDLPEPVNLIPTSAKLKLNSVNGWKTPENSVDQNNAHENVVSDHRKEQQHEIERKIKPNLKRIHSPEHGEHNVIQGSGEPLPESSTSISGAAVLDKCMTIYFVQLNQTIAKHDMATLNVNDFFEAEKNAKARVLEELTNHISDDQLQHWQKKLDEKILLWNKMGLQIFMSKIDRENRENSGNHYRNETARQKENLIMKLMQENTKRIQENQMQTDTKLEKILVAFQDAQVRTNQHLLDIKQEQQIDQLSRNDNEAELEEVYGCLPQCVLI